MGAGGFDFCMGAIRPSLKRLRTQRSTRIAANASEGDLVSNSTITFGPCPTRATAVHRVAECVADCGLQVAALDDLTELRRLAAELIGGKVMSTSALRAIQVKTGSTVLKFEQEGRIVGGVAIAQLTVEGLDALIRGVFDPTDPRLDHFASGGGTVAALYGLAIGATTPEGARAVVEGTVRLRAFLGDSLDFYAYGATEAGRRVLVTRLGCAECSPGLYRSPAQHRERAA